MANKESPSDFPGFNAAEHKASLAALEGVKTVTPEAKPAFDKSLEKPPVLVAEDAGVSDDGHEIFDKIPNLLFRAKEDRKALKSFHDSLSRIADAFEYKEDRTDAETVFLTEVLEGKIKVSGDLNRKGVTADPEKMPVFERIDKAEWLAEQGAVAESEKELEIAKTQVALIEERIRIAYSAIPKKNPQ
ncbi:MAG: hypothetical protein WA194_09790 [Patescibacteria group bacterium]